jgi:hypothetical protein
LWGALERLASAHKSVFRAPPWAAPCPAVIEFQDERLDVEDRNDHVALAGRADRLVAARDDFVQDAAEIWTAGCLVSGSKVALVVRAD